MSVNMVRARDKDTLAQFLGWFSVGLGTAQLAAPGALARLVGAKGEGASKTIMRAMGARELTQGVGILTRPRPTAWVWSRVAGDVLDLSLLALTAAKSKRRGRAVFGIVSVLGVTAPDIFEALFLARKKGPVRGAMLVRKAVTVNKPQDAVESAWLQEEELQRIVREADGRVRFESAPGDRGTEVIVEFEFDPPAGDLGAAAAKLTGKDPATQLADKLRLFKQRIETGEVVRSDATPGGHNLAEHLKQRAAQPLRIGATR